MADCRAGQIDLIITKSVSRFGRNTVDVLKACRELKTLGVDILFEIENLWLSNQHSDLLLTILASCHQAESESKSGSIRWGIQRSFESPESRYHNRTCFGYQKGKDGHLAIRDDEAAIVRLIFALYAEGMSIRQVIHELERCRIPSPRLHLKWCVECVSKMLSNEKYTGDILLGKTFVKNFFDGRQVRNGGMRTRYLVQDRHPAIIPNDLFERVQAEKRRRTKHVK